MKAKTRDKRQRQDTRRYYWEVGRHCVEPRISLLSFLLFSFFFLSFYLFGMNECSAFFLDFYRVFLLGSLTSSSGKYIHILKGLDRIFISISISISHAATVLLLPTSY